MVVDGVDRHPNGDHLAHHRLAGRVASLGPSRPRLAVVHMMDHGGEVVLPARVRVVRAVPNLHRRAVHMMDHGVSLPRGDHLNLNGDHLNLNGAVHQVGDHQVHPAVARVASLEVEIFVDYVVMA